MTFPGVILLHYRSMMGTYSTGAGSWYSSLLCEIGLLRRSIGMLGRLRANFAIDLDRFER